MILQDLEKQFPSKLYAGANTAEAPKRRDRSRLLNRGVQEQSILFLHEGKVAYLALWLIEGTEALVLTGPLIWLPEKTNWFCRSYQDLADLLIDQMYEVWGAKHCEQGDAGASLDDVCHRISYIRTSSKETSQTKFASDSLLLLRIQEMLLLLRNDL